MNIDYNVNNVDELERVLNYVKHYHDDIIITVENDEYECLRVYYDEIYKNYNLDVLDTTNYLIVNDFIVKSIDEIKMLIVEAYGLCR